MLLKVINRSPLFSKNICFPPDPPTFLLIRSGLLRTVYPWIMSWWHTSNTTSWHFGVGGYWREKTTSPVNFCSSNNQLAKNELILLFTKKKKHSTHEAFTSLRHWTPGLCHWPSTAWRLRLYSVHCVLHICHQGAAGMAKLLNFILNFPLVWHPGKILSSTISVFANYEDLNIESWGLLTCTLPDKWVDL